MSKLDLKLTVTFGRYVYPESYRRIHFEITEEFDKAEISREEATNKVRKFVDDTLAQELMVHKAKNGDQEPRIPKTETPTPTRKEGESLPIHIPDLERAKWTSYSTKQACEKGESGWAFSNNPLVKDLTDLLTKEKEVHVSINDVRYVCSFSGPKNKPQLFIVRNPVSKERSNDER